MNEQLAMLEREPERLDAETKARGLRNIERAREVLAEARRRAMEDA